jgi:endonuclease/exonuclease/phosphatase family metal-dependent hydrolase
LAGDLNAAIDDPELSPLGPLLVDAFAAPGVPAGDERRRSCGTDPIDHVLLRGFEVEECRVAHEAGDLSDHLPIIARLRLSGGAGSSESATGRAAG